jgi:hypothetical protein
LNIYRGRKISANPFLSYSAFHIKTKLQFNRVNGVMFSMHVALHSKNRDWLTWNKNNVSE